MGVNHKPIIRGTDNAIWDRIKLIPFNYRISRNEQIDNYEDILLHENSGILNWAISGCLGWQKEKLEPEPEGIQKAISGYRQEMDTIGLFLEECCELDEKETVKFSDLYETYKRWCEKGGERNFLSKKALGTALKERGFNNRRDWGAQGKPVVYEGIKLIDRLQERFENAQYYG